ncbi:hypothetical protein CHISP_0164 [Chitinispirillum alkaliphilum]|nr:hypothetical protein CHISP_0164 [Chitinispirillum alkaliphilum]
MKPINRELPKQLFSYRSLTSPFGFLFLILLFSATYVHSLPLWDPATIYPNPGFDVQWNGRWYTNKWWSQGEQPDLNSNGLGTDVWTDNGVFLEAGSLSGGISPICQGAATGVISISGHSGVVERWERRVDGEVWENIPNTSTTYSETPSSAGVWDYRVRISDGAGSFAYTDPLTIIVHSSSVGGSISGGNTPICQGTSTGTMTLSGQNGEIVRWEKRVNNGEWIGIDNTTISFSETPSAAGSWDYRAVVKNESCPETYSSIRTILVQELSVGGSITGGTTPIEPGISTGTMTLSGHTGNVVRWQKRVDNGDWVNISNTSLTYSEIPSSEGTWNYRAEVKNGECPSVFSNIRTIIVGGGGGEPGTDTLSLSIRHLYYHSFSSYGDNNGRVGGFARGNTFGSSNEALLYADLDYLNCAFISNARLEFYIPHVNTDATLRTATLYEQNKGGHDPNAHYLTYEDVAWDNSLGSVTDNTTGWKSITGDDLRTLVQDWVSGAKQNEGFILGGNFGHATFYWDISDARLIVDYTPFSGGSITGGNSPVCHGSSTGTMTLSEYSGSIAGWQRRVDNSTWQDISNTSNTHSETPPSPGVWEYRARIQSGSCYTYSTVTSITVDANSVGGSISGGISPICQGSSTGPMTLNGHTGVVIRWERRLNGGEWSNIATTATTYSETPSSAGIWEYRAAVQNGVCAPAYSSIRSVTVEPLSVGGIVSGGSTVICQGATTGEMSLSGHNGNVVRWQKRVDGGQWVDIDNTSTTYSHTPTTPGAWEYRAEVKNGTCQSVFSASQTITVEELSDGGTLSGGTSPICLEASAGVLTLSDHTGEVLRWQRRVNGGQWTDIIFTGTSAIVTPVNAGTNEYRVVVRNGTCTEATSSVRTIFVNAPPEAPHSPVHGQRCGTGSVTLTASVPDGVTIDWYDSDSSGSIVPGGEGVLNFTTPSISTSTTYYAEARNTTTGCISTSRTAVTATVHPSSSGGSLTGGATPICIGSSTGTITLSGYTGSVVRWQRRLNGGTWVDIPNTADTHSEIPLAAGIWEFRAEVKNLSCPSVFSSIRTIVVEPASEGGTIDAQNTRIILGQSTGDMTLNGHTGEIIKWQKRIEGEEWQDIAHAEPTFSETPPSANLWEYRVVVQSGSCQKAYSSIKSIDVETPSVVAGSGSALSFDGENDFLSLPLGCIVSGDVFTLEFWVKPDNPEANSRIFIQAYSACGPRQIMAVWTGNSISFVTGEYTNAAYPEISSGIIPDGKWSHVAWIYNGTSSTVYVNGKISSTPDETYYSLDGGNSIASRGGTQNFFRGQLDEIRFWNTTRTPHEIEQNMYSPLPGNKTGLQGYWRFDEGTGPTAMDATPNQNHGNLQGAPEWIDSRAWKYRTVEDVSQLFHGAGYNPGGDSIIISEINGPVSGFLDIDNHNNRLWYTPVLNSSGTFSYTYQVTDGVSTDEYTVEVSVSNINAAPVAGSGNALRFTGTGNGVRLRSLESRTNKPVSLEVWVYWNGTATSGIWGHRGNSGNNTHFEITPEGLRIRLGNVDIRNLQTPPVEQWTHLAVTHDGSETQVFMNGKSTGSESGSTGEIFGAEWHILGCSHLSSIVGYDRIFDGKIDELRIWSKSLTQSNIQMKMHTPLGGNEPDLLAYYRFDNSEGMMLRDYSPNRHHGVLHNMSDESWLTSEAFKERRTGFRTPLTHSGGYDPDGDAVTISKVSAPSQGSLSFDNSNRTVTFTPAVAGTFTYTYRISDGTHHDDYTMTVVVVPEMELLPLTVRTNGADQCSVYTDRWMLIFDNSSGGGISFLSYDEGPNLAHPTHSLYYFNIHGILSTSDGTWRIIDSSAAHYAKLRQSGVINGITYTVDYTIHGSGRIFIRTEFHNRSGGSITSSVYRHGIARKEGGNNITTAHTNASLSPYVLLSNSGTGEHDLLLVIKDLWNVSYGAQNSASGFIGGSDLAGLEKSSPTVLDAGQKQVWEFMLHFANKEWEPAGGVATTAMDYRTPDSLEFIAGTPLMESAWEHHLRGHWKFDEVMGSKAFDNSGAGRNGTVTGGTWVNGKLEGALQVSSAQYVELGNLMQLSGTEGGFTVMGWIAPSATLSSSSVVFGKHDGNSGYRLTADTGGRLAFQADGTILSGVREIQTGQWSHVAVSFNGADSVKLFVDGRIDRIHTGYYTVSSNDVQAIIGHGYTGKLDDFRFYNERISEKTIKSIYQRGYSAATGFYHLRADDNSTTHFHIDGSRVARRFPVFEIANYWSESLPAAVVLNGSPLVLNDDYYAHLRGQKLSIGLNRVIASNSRLFIDKQSDRGAHMINPSKTLSWGDYTDGSSDYFWVKNAGDQFGEVDAGEFFIVWKSGPVNETRCDEIWYLATSCVNPFTSVDTISTTNQIQGQGEGYDESWGTVKYQIGSGWPATSYSVSSAQQDLTLLEASPARVRLQLNERVASSLGESFTVTTRWTIYPSGQIFRWDSITNVSGSPIRASHPFLLRGSENQIARINGENMRGVVYNGTGITDFAVTFLAFSNDTDTINWPQSPWALQTIRAFADQDMSGILFKDRHSDPMENWGPSHTPIQVAFYQDIRRTGMDSLYMDSVSMGVQNILFDDSDVFRGSRVTNSIGDLNGNGFNEAEGAYILEAENNTVHFRLNSDAYTCRFNPVIRITEYRSSQKPQYIFLYDQTDTLTLLRNYQYNIHHDRNSHQLIIQLDTVLCNSVNFYLSSDITLAVTLAGFYAHAGDGVDTLFWQTDSEQDNLGFHIYRRIKPQFMDSLIISVKITETDTLVSNAAKLLKQNRIGLNDTTWVRVNRRIIPGAESGVSYGTIEYQYIDHAVSNDVLYEYKLIAVDFSDMKEVVGYAEAMPRARIPVEFSLGHNFPNPFRGSTTIRFELPVETVISLNIYDLRGRLVRQLVKPDKPLKADFYRIVWDGTNDSGQQVGAGPYFYRLRTKDFVGTRRMIRL